MFDPERDDDRGSRRFYLRMLAVVVISAAGCLALWPSVSGFAAGPDHLTGCIAIRDGWHGDKAHPSDAEVKTAYAAYPALPTAAERNDPTFMAKFRAQLRALDASPVVQQANAYADWVSGPGACIHESRHRLMLSAAGLGALVLVCTGVGLVRRTRTNLRRSPAVDGEPDAGSVERVLVGKS